jgi:hypothetical protein
MMFFLAVSMTPTDVRIKPTHPAVKLMTINIVLDMLGNFDLYSFLDGNYGRLAKTLWD